MNSQAEDNKTGFKIYSIGIVVENKPKGSDYILVTPIEVLNIQPSGPILDNTTNYQGTLPSVDSSNFSTEHSSKNYIRAKWLPLGHSNRVTAPDVIASETVILFKYGNEELYYWTTLMREPSLRRLETVVYSYSNVRGDVGIESYDANKSYYVEVSTDDKLVALHTSMSDSEPYGYDIELNTKIGYLNIRDTSENFIELNSPEDTITVRTNKKVIIDAPTIILAASNGSIVLDGNGVHIAGDKISYSTSTGGVKSIDLDNPNSRSDKTTKDITGGTDNGIEIECNTMTTRASAITNDTPTVHNTGDTVTDGVSRASDHV